MYLMVWRANIDIYVSRFKSVGEMWYGARVVLRGVDATL